jgi:hypothetical protein
MSRKPVIDYTLVTDGFLFDRPLYHCRYRGTSSGQKTHWLKVNKGSYRRLDDVLQESAALEAPDNAGNAATGPTCETSSRDVLKDGDDDNDATLVDARPEDYLYQPTSPTTPVKANVPTGSAQTGQPPRAKTATTETIPFETEKTPLGTLGRKPGRGGGHRLKKQKSPPGDSKVGPKLSPERMRIVLNSLGKCPILSRAARKAGIHRKTLKYWMKCSAAGHDGYDIKWQGVQLRFHEHCESAIDQAHDRILLAAWKLAMGYTTDQHLVDLGYRGVDAYARDGDGNFIEGAIRPANNRMLRFVLELLRPETYKRKRRKIDDSHEGGVLILGDATKPRESNTAASVKARKWKSHSRTIRNAKAELLREFS